METTSSNNYLQLDGSMILYQCWFRMDEKELNTEKLELAQFAKNLAEELFKYKHRFNPADYTIALDDKPWRNRFFDFWYRRRINYYQNIENPDYWIVHHNHRFQIAKLNPMSMEWEYPKTAITKKDDFAKLRLDDTTLWDYYPGGKPCDDLKAKYPGGPSNVRLHPHWKHLQHDNVKPRYKGGRGKSWTYNTSYSDFKKYGEILLRRLAPLVCARCLKVDNAEADDIAPMYALWVQEQNPNANVIYVATDKDWDQIGYMTTATVYRWIPQTSTMVQKSKELARYQMYLKILGGDAGDGIFGSKSANQAKPFVEVSYASGTDEVKGGKNTVKYAKRILDSVDKDFERFEEMMRKYQDDGSFERNHFLVHLGRTPEKIRQAIWACIWDTEVLEPFEGSTTLSDFRFKRVDQIKAKGEAEKQKELDILDGLVH